MGKKRIVTSGGASADKGKVSRQLSKVVKKKTLKAVVNVNSTYNNTMISISDPDGRVMAWSSSGALGFKGAKKGTPYAAGKIAEVISEKADMAGVKDLDVVLCGVGSGREAAVRVFIGKGYNILSIEDRTPIPFNGPKAKKPRRV